MFENRAPVSNGGGFLVLLAAELSASELAFRLGFRLQFLNLLYVLEVQPRNRSVDNHSVFIEWFSVLLFPKHTRR